MKIIMDHQCQMADLGIDSYTRAIVTQLLIAQDNTIGLHEVYSR